MSQRHPLGFHRLDGDQMECCWLKCCQAFAWEPLLGNWSVETPILDCWGIINCNLSLRHVFSGRTVPAYINDKRCSTFVAIFQFNGLFCSNCFSYLVSPILILGVLQLDGNLYIAINYSMCCSIACTYPLPQLDYHIENENQCYPCILCAEALPLYCNSSFYSSPL